MDILQAMELSWNNKVFVRPVNWTKLEEDFGVSFYLFVNDDKQDFTKYKNGQVIPTTGFKPYEILGQWEIYSSRRN